MKSLCQQVLAVEHDISSQSSSKNNKHAKQRLVKALQNEAKILAKLVPGFVHLLSSEPGEPDWKRTDAAGGNSSSFASTSIPSLEKDGVLGWHRVAVGLQVFLQSFCGETTPLILFLDDLQWADTNSLRVLTAVLQDAATNRDPQNSSSSSCWMLLASYRDDHEDSNAFKTVVQPFVNRLEEFVEKSNNKDGQSQLSLSQIHLSNLELPAVQDVVAHVLSVPLSRPCQQSPHNDDDDANRVALRELSFVVHHKTMGNPFFVLQFLHMLHQETALVYNPLLLGWQRDLSHVKGTTNVADNVAQIVQQR